MELGFILGLALLVIGLSGLLNSKNAKKVNTILNQIPPKQSGIDIIESEDGEIKMLVKHAKAHHQLTEGVFVNHANRKKYRVLKNTYQDPKGEFYPVYSVEPYSEANNSIQVTNEDRKFPLEQIHNLLEYVKIGRHIISLDPTTLQLVLLDDKTVPDSGQILSYYTVDKYDNPKYQDSKVIDVYDKYLFNITKLEKKSTTNKRVDVIRQIQNVTSGQSAIVQLPLITVYSLDKDKKLVAEYTIKMGTKVTIKYTFKDDATGQQFYAINTQPLYIVRIEDVQVLNS